MHTLKEVGGVRVFGHNAEGWLKENQRWIQGCPVQFDSDVYSPDVDTGSFLFPAHRGQLDYQVHLLENGAAFVIKDDRVYLCATVDEVPRVTTFTTVPSGQNLTALF
jgi:hypothetical protein